MLNNSSYLELCQAVGASYNTRSTFYPLKPIGIGTPYMECLSSYIIRLSEAHKIRLSEVVKSALKVQGLAIKQPSVKKLNGMGTNVVNILNGLELLTSRNDLKLLGTLNWKGFIKNKNLNKEYKSWCPNCIDEWKKIGHILYEPLIWQITGIHFCYKHNTRLVSECHSCKQTLEICSDLERIGYCVKCAAFLGYKSYKEYKATGFEKEITDYIAEIIVNAWNISKLKPELNDEAITLKQIPDKVNGRSSVAFRFFKESSAEYKFFKT